MATVMYPSLTKSQSMRSKRKSAVELLAESKAFYVKSEMVRDTTQALPLRTTTPSLVVSGGPGTYFRSKSVSVTTSSANKIVVNSNWRHCIAVSPSRSLPPPRVCGRRSACSDVLQNKLRQLLDSCDSAEELSVEQLAPLSPPAEYAQQRCHKSLPDLHCQREPPSSNKSSNKSLSNRDSGGSSGHYTQRSEPPPPPRQDTRRDSGSSTQHSGGSSYYCCGEPECRPTTRLSYAVVAQPSATTTSTTTSTFKRQKCLRYKRERPILRSKSDISDRYWRPPEPPVSHLEQFFEQLGLTSDSYESMLSDSRSSCSPVFFSDVSTVDSNRQTDNVEYCSAVNFRPSEPPSIVERNARIIKWLCNCRKLQLS